MGAIITTAHLHNKYEKVCVLATMAMTIKYYYIHRGTLEPCAWWGNQQRD